MRKNILQILTILCAACPVAGLAQAPKDAVVISNEDIKAVLKYAADTKRTIPDNSIRVIDMGKYQLAVAVIHLRQSRAREKVAGTPSEFPSSARRGILLRFVSGITRWFLLLEVFPTTLSFAQETHHIGEVLLGQRILVAGHAGTSGFDLRCDSLIVDRLS